MSEEPPVGETPPRAADDSPSAAEEAAHTEAWERQRRVGVVVGVVGGVWCRDERSPAPSERESSSDAWLRAQVPPHHG